MQGERERLLLLAAQHGENTVAGHAGQRLGIVEIVPELLRRGGLVRRLRRGPGAHPAVLPEPFAQGADELGVLGGALDDDVAGTVECRRGVGADEVGGGGLGYQRGIGEQPVGQGLEPRFASDLGLRAPFGLEGQIDVLDARLGLGGHQRRSEFGGQLALLVDRGQHRVAAVVELTQITQTLIELAQLGVVETAGGFLAVPGDERHGRALVEQPDGGRDLVLPTASSAASRVLNEGRAVGRLFWVVLEFTRRTLPNHPDRGVADTTVRR